MQDRERESEGKQNEKAGLNRQSKVLNKMSMFGQRKRSFHLSDTPVSWG